MDTRSTNLLMRADSMVLEIVTFVYGIVILYHLMMPIRWLAERAASVFRPQTVQRVSGPMWATSCQTVDGKVWINGSRHYLTGYNVEFTKNGVYVDGVFHRRSEFPRV